MQTAASKKFWTILKGVIIIIFLITYGENGPYFNRKENRMLKISIPRIETNISKESKQGCDEIAEFARRVESLHQSGDYPIKKALTDIKTYQETKQPWLKGIIYQAYGMPISRDKRTVIINFSNSWYNMCVIGLENLNKKE